MDRTRPILPAMTSVLLFFFFLLIRPPPISTLFPYTTLFRSAARPASSRSASVSGFCHPSTLGRAASPAPADAARDRKSTRLNSSHVSISYAVFCLKKKKRKNQPL